MKKILIAALLFILFPLVITGADGKSRTQSIFHVENFGFFDNREVHSPYQFSGTYFGTRLGADGGFQFGNSSVAAGGYVIKDFGQRGLSASDWTLYYRYQGDRFSGAFGSFPRSLLFRELPDVFVDEVLRYYTPNLSGALFQMKTYRYGVPNGFVELYCDWLSRQSYTEREIFEIVSDGEWHAALPLTFGYNARLTHFSVRKGTTPDRVYDKLMLNPYTTFHHGLGKGGFSLTAGLMASLNRDRNDKVWKTPIGFLSDARLGLPLFRNGTAIELRDRLYAGQPLMSDYELYGTLLHRGDPYYRSSFYNRTDISLILLHKGFDDSFSTHIYWPSIDCRITASFHYTESILDYSQQIRVRLLFY